MHVTGYQHFVMVVQPALLVCDVGLWLNVVFCSDDLAEGLVFKGFSGNIREIPGCGVMFRVMKAVGIDKVGVFASELLRSGVHHIYKVRDTAAHKLSYAG